MTPRENMLRVFSDEKPEWVPLVGHIDPYNQPNQEGMDPGLAEQLKDVKWQDETTVAFSRYLGIDIMDYLNPPLQITRKNVTVESSTDGRDTTTVWHTPIGDLREVVRQSDSGAASYKVAHQVENPEHLPILAYIFEDEIIDLTEECIARVRVRKELIGDDGMLMFFCPGTPMGMMYRAYSGVEPLVYCHVDAPDALKDLFKVMEKNYQERYRLALQMGPDALVGMDDTSTTVISPSMFEEYNMELTDQRAEIAHSGGALYFHHSCGLIHDLLDLYRQTKMDAVHAFTPPPTGDVTVREGRGLIGDKITIITGAAPLGGNMDDRAAAAENIREMFDGAGDRDRFVIGIAGYPDKTMEQTQFIVNECKKYQKIA